MKCLIFCNKNDNIEIFDKENPYKFFGKIHFVSNGNLFNPPFFNIVILFESRIEDNENLKLLWNITTEFLILPNKYNFFNNVNSETKTYKNYTMIHKNNKIVYNPTNKYRYIDFLIIGAQKAGTTAAMLNLRKHPDISMPDNETHFFSIYWYKGINWYKNHFDYSKKMIGEKTPDYMYLEHVFPLIQSLNPFVKLIFFLRNPINRAYSAWNMLRSKWGETKTFEEVVDEELEFRIDESKNLYNSTYHILQHGLYAQQINKLLKWFSIHNMIFLISEVVIDNMEVEYNKIYKFLGIDVIDNQHYEREFEGTYIEKINPQTYNKLVDFFKNDVAELEKITNINVSKLWSI